ncbi:MAG: phosphatase PAP2 family protein [Planctomycetes bacterium]|nr:phosphatase PAP2 family protein [Planctomycetota bacterium]
MKLRAHLRYGVLGFFVLAAAIGENGPSDRAPLNPIEKADQAVKEWASEHVSDAADSLFDAARWFGDWRLYAGVTAAFTAAGEDEFGELAIKAGAINGVATESLRWTVGRVRPRNASGPDEYRTGGHSFPSGHTSAAFALATALDETYGVGYVTYPVATLTAFSRLYHGGHWLSDTLVGAGIGIASAKAVALHDEDRVDFDESADVYGEAFGAYTLADLLASHVEKGPARMALRAAAVGFAASRIEEEEDVYAALAGVATSLVLTRGIKKLHALRFTPNSVSLVWEW